MRKVVRGYAKDKNNNLVLIGAIPLLHSKENALQRNAGTKDIWSGKAQRFLRKKLFANRTLQT